MNEPQYVASLLRPARIPARSLSSVTSVMEELQHLVFQKKERLRSPLSNPGQKRDICWLNNEHGKERNGVEKDQLEQEVGIALQLPNYTPMTMAGTKDVSSMAFRTKEIFSTGHA